MSATEPVTIHQAKTSLSKLVALAERGVSTPISRGHAAPSAMIVPAPAEPRRRLGGIRSGQVPEDFDTMAADEIAAQFEGRS